MKRNVHAPARPATLKPSLPVRILLLLVLLAAPVATLSSVAYADGGTPVKTDNGG